VKRHARFRVTALRVERSNNLKIDSIEAETKSLAVKAAFR
jgi:hypothetical protein